MNQQTPTPRFNRFLFAGTIVFGTKDESGAMQPLGSAPVNTILSKSDEESVSIAIKDIARAQQQMQANFIKKIGFETPVTILDVVVSSISQIVFSGTDAEWEEGMAKEENNEPATS